MSFVWKSLTITEKCGLYYDIYQASPVSKMVSTAEKFDSHIGIKAKGKIVDGKSAWQVAALELCYGDEMTICADGIDAQYAINTLVALVESNFGKEGTRRDALDKTQFTMLGMSGSGKTCYLLGMYDEMVGGLKGFSLTTDDDTDVNLRHRYEIMDDATKGQDRFPAGTDQKEEYDFTLEYGFSPIMGFHWLDYPGGWLDEKSQGDSQQYSELEYNINKSLCLFICVDGALLQGDDNEVKTRLLKRKCSKLINPFLSRYLASNNNLPPTAIVITKSDLCRADNSDDDLREIIEEAFSPLFVKNADKKSNRFVSIMSVSLGSNIAENNYKGMLAPKGLQLPIFMGVWFALEIYKEVARDEANALKDQQRGFEKCRDEEKDKWFFRRDDNKVNGYDRMAREKHEERLSVLEKIESASDNQNKLMDDLNKKVAIVYFNGSRFEAFADAAKMYMETRR